MEIRTQPNFNFETGEEVFGLSIRIDGGRRYCKYPAGHQNYKTIGDASEAAAKMMGLHSMERILNMAKMVLLESIKPSMKIVD